MTVHLVTLGGSDIGAVAGLNPYRSALRVSAEKLGRVAPPAESEPMRLGKTLEPLIASLQGEWVPAPAEGVTDAGHRWIVGHPDAFSVVNGERAVLECKNVGANVARHEWQESAPLYVQSQCQWYCYLTGLRYWRVAALIGGQRFATFEGRYEPDSFALLYEAGEAFVRLVRRGKLATADDSEDARGVLVELYPEHAEGARRRLGKEGMEHVRALRDIHALQDTLKRQRLEHENWLKTFAENADTLISPHDDEVARWRTYSRSALDTKALRAAHPALADEFTTTTTTRRFTLL